MTEDNKTEETTVRLTVIMPKIVLAWIEKERKKVLPHDGVSTFIVRTLNEMRIEEQEPIDGGGL